MKKVLSLTGLLLLGSLLLAGCKKDPTTEQATPVSDAQPQTNPNKVAKIKNAGANGVAGMKGFR